MGLIQPFTGNRSITQGYGPTSNTFEPSYGGYDHFHTGTDYAVPANTPLYAATSGKVTFAGADTTGFGNRVDITFGNGFRILYGHLNSIGVKVGQVVQAGEKIGLSGSTGNSTGPHLHFAISQNGSWFDPSGLFTAEPKGDVKTPGGGSLWDNITGLPGAAGSTIGNFFQGTGDAAHGAINTVTDLPGKIADGFKITAGALWESVRKYIFIAGLLLVALVIIAAIVKGE